MKKYPTFTDIAIVIGVYLGASVLVSLIGMLMVTLGVSQGVITTVCYILIMGITLGFAVYFRNMRSGETGWPKFNYSLKTRWFPAMAWALLLIAACSVVLEPLLALFPEEWYENILKNLGHGGWALVAPVLIAPVIEELLFRGVIQTPATEKFGAFKGILLASAVFGIVHGVPQQVINCFVVGIILGYVYYKTRSLTPVIILHFINNSVAMIGSDGRQPQSLREMISNDPVYYIIYGVAITLVVIGTFHIARNLNKKED